MHKFSKTAELFHKMSMYYMQVGDVRLEGVKIIFTFQNSFILNNTCLGRFQEPMKNTIFVIAIHNLLLK
jgi:hypothetical protein